MRAGARGAVASSETPRSSLATGLHERARRSRASDLTVSLSRSESKS